MTEDNEPYVRITNSKWFGYKIDIIAPGYFPNRRNRSDLMLYRTYFTFTFKGAKAKGTRKFTKFLNLRDREIQAVRVNP